MVMAPANHEDETYIHCKKCKLLFLDASFFLIVAWLHGRADPLALSPSTQTHSRTFNLVIVVAFEDISFHTCALLSLFGGADAVALLDRVLGARLRLRIPEPVPKADGGQRMRRHA